MGLEPEQIPDLVNAVTRDLGREKLTQVAQTLVSHPAMGQILQPGKIQKVGGYGKRFNILTRKAENAKFVKIGDKDNPTIPDVLDYGFADHRFSQWDWSVDVREVMMASESEQRVVDLIMARMEAGYIDWVELMEKHFWATAIDPTETKKPNNLQTLVASNSTTGFNGGVPDETGWSGTNTLTGIDVTATALGGRFNNYTAEYTDVSSADLADKMEAGHMLTRWRAPAGSRINTEMPERAYYTSLQVTRGLKKIAQSQNDNLGKDPAGFTLTPEGDYIFYQVPVKFVPELEELEVHDVFGIDWTFMHPFCLSGEWKRETKAQSDDDHSMVTKFMNYSLNMYCNNRRAQQRYKKAAA